MRQYNRSPIEEDDNLELKVICIGQVTKGIGVYEPVHQICTGASRDRCLRMYSVTLSDLQTE